MILFLAEVNNLNTFNWFKNEYLSLEDRIQFDIPHSEIESITHKVKDFNSPYYHVFVSP